MYNLFHRYIQVIAKPQEAGHHKRSDGDEGAPVPDSPVRGERSDIEPVQLPHHPRQANGWEGGDRASCQVGAAQLHKG